MGELNKALANTGRLHQGKMKYVETFKCRGTEEVVAII